MIAIQQRDWPNSIVIIICYIALFTALANDETIDFRWRQINSQLGNSVLRSELTVANYQYISIFIYVL